MNKPDFEHGIHLINTGKEDAAWSYFYKLLQQIESSQPLSQEIHKIRFMILYEIGKIQQNKHHYDAAKITFEKAELIRKTFLADLDIEPIKQIGLPKWEADFEMMKELDQNEHYFALVAMGQLTIEEMEALDYSEQTRNYHRLLWRICELMYRSYVAINEPEKADLYDAKAEDIAFIHDFDRFSSSD